MKKWVMAFVLMGFLTSCEGEKKVPVVEERVVEEVDADDGTVQGVVVDDSVAMVDEDDLSEDTMEDEEDETTEGEDTY